MRSPREISTLNPVDAGCWVWSGLEIIVFMLKSPEKNERAQLIASAVSRAGDGRVGDIAVSRARQCRQSRKPSLRPDGTPRCANNPSSLLRLRNNRFQKDP
jgi:hypothetical protein